MARTATSWSTTAPRASSSRQQAEGLQTRREGKRRRRGHLGRRDLDGDHLVGLERDLARIPGVRLGALAVAEVDEHLDLLVAGQSERRDMCRVEPLRVATVRL